LPFRYSVGSSKNEKWPEGQDGLDSQSRLMFHSLIMGRTGTGKSNLLKHLIMKISGMENSNLIVIDFHGNMASHVIDLCRNRNLVYLSPAGSEKYKVRMNVLSGSADSPISMYLLSQIFSQEGSLSGGTWGPRLQTIFTAVLREVVRQNENPTLSEFLAILMDREKMQKLKTDSREETAAILSNLIRRWDSWIEYSMSTVNKLFPIVSDPDVSGFISSKNETVNLHEELRAGSRLVVIDASKTHFSIQQGRIISSMILNKLWNDILKNGNEMNTMIVVDEAQNLNSSLVSEILSEGRKFNLYITLASQYLGQYDRGLRDAMISNCGNIYCFNMSEDDADDICSLISDSRMKSRAMKSIMLGEIHNVTTMDLMNTGGISINTFKPELIRRMPDRQYVEAAIEESVKKHGNSEGIPELEIKQEEKGTHDLLKNNFSDYLRKKSITVLDEEYANGLRPDILYFIKGNPVIVEIEVSDLLRVERTVRKACNYSRTDLIFLCPRDSGLLLYRIFKDREKIKKMLEKLESHGEFTFFNPERITIIEERGGRYFFVHGGSLRRWSVEKSWEGTSRTFKVSYAPDERMALAILRKMERERKHHTFIRASEIAGRIEGNSELSFEICLSDLYE
jgi:hypothetical protein